MNQKTSFEIVNQYLTNRIRDSMEKLDASVKNKINEIRLRIGQGISLVFCNSIKYLNDNGTCTELLNDRSMIICRSDIENIVGKLTHYSIHCCNKEFRQGYFVIENGIRVGISGEYSDFENPRIRNVTGLNFRIARECKGCAEEIIKRIGLKSILICGSVNSGKTTILRDICRLYGQRNKLSLIDERNEISCSVHGEILNDIGQNTDVIAGVPRSFGINSAIRTLSPDIIVCDEISDYSDVEAIKSSVGSGVSFIASIHADSYENLMKRNIMKKLVECEAFEYAVILKGKEFPSQIREIRRISGA